MSSLQHEHFVRDFFHKSLVKSPKQAFRRFARDFIQQSHENEHFARDFLQKSSGKPHRSTHIKESCQAVPRFQPLAHTPIPIFLATFTSTSTRNLTIPCACHENLHLDACNTHYACHDPPPHLATSQSPAPATTINCTPTPQNTHKVLCLQHHIDVSVNKICTTPHVWNDFDAF